MAVESTVFEFAVSRRKQLLARRETYKSMEASPAYANGTLFVMTNDRLYAIQEAKPR